LIYSFLNCYKRVEEIAKYDIPAMIDYILEETGEEKLAFIGFGQGAVAGLCAVEKEPSLSNRISLMVTLNPTIKYTNSKSPLIQLLTKIDMSKLNVRFSLGPYTIRIDVFLSNP
jgi:lysosomal acid lipase/cholesteryl ester hydrolase